ncbi:hypothetical protein SASC598O02_002310 [Snodgrassella alvi SCGC AB-598-O02]|nr:hypothetical protein SASC598O02_002310 [Snodgrassella alvi SCGC AB-598-O02]
MVRDTFGVFEQVVTVSGHYFSYGNVAGFINLSDSATKK